MFNDSRNVLVLSARILVSGKKTQHPQAYDVLGTFDELHIMEYLYGVTENFITGDR